MISRLDDPFYVKTEFHVSVSAGAKYRTEVFTAAWDKVAIVPCTVRNAPQDQVHVLNTEEILACDGAEPVSPIETLDWPVRTERITQLCFGNRKSPRLLVGASVNEIICWTLHGPRSQSLLWAETKGAAGRIIKEGLGAVHHLRLGPEDRLLVCCVGSVVNAVELHSGKVVALEGHQGKVTGAEFLFRGATRFNNCEDWIISVSEDRTFKVWDIANRTCLYQSAILSQYSITTVAADPTRQRFSIGAEDGKVRFYDFESQGKPGACEPRCLTTIDVPMVSARSKSWGTQSPSSLSPSPSVERVSSFPAWRRSREPDDGEAAEEGLEYCVEHSAAILSLHYVTIDEDWRRIKWETPFGDDSSINTPFVRLIVGSSTGLTVLGTYAYEALFHVDFSSPLPPPRSSLSIECGEETQKGTIVGTVGGFSFASPEGNPACTLVLAGNALQREVCALALREALAKSVLHGDKGAARVIAKAAEPDNNESLQELVERTVKGHVMGEWSVHVYRDCLTELAALGITSKADLRQESRQILPRTIPGYVQDALAEHMIGGHGHDGQCELLSLRGIPHAAHWDPGSPFHKADEVGPRYKPKDIKPAGPSKKMGTSRKSGVVDQPVTFRTKVKSSGYTEAPKVTKLFTRPGAGKKVTGTSITRTSEHPAYPADCEPMVTPLKLPIPLEHSAPITCIKYHSSGRYLATASADRTSRFYRLPMSTKTISKDFMGHNGMVTSVSWSHGDQCLPHHATLLLTSSTDGVVRMWTPEKSESILEIRHLKQKHATSASRASPHPASDALSADIRHGRFFYSNKLIAIPSASRVHFFTYRLERPEPGSVKPMLNRNRYDLAYSINSPSQTVTAFACPNAFPSHLCLFGTSDKSLRIWDGVKCQIARSMPDAHARAIHFIAIPDYASPPPIGENLFATAAVTDSVKCWDIRTSRAVMHLHGHVNRHASVGCAISPCGRFIATGSEDNHAYLYDIRKGSVVGKTTGHVDVVSAVDFNPIHPELATAGYDRKGRIYR